MELDLLLERVNEITKQADQRNRENIQSQSDKVTEEWTSLVSELENRRDTLTGLAQVKYLHFVASTQIYLFRYRAQSKMFEY